MKINDFILRYNNQHVEIFNRSAGFQCFDLAELWGDFLGLPRIVFQHANASQIYTNTTPEILKYVDKIPNTPDAIPKAGDIVCWDATLSGTGGAGHVAIATGLGNLNTFQAFTQNNPIPEKSVLHDFNYNKVLGWLRSKVTTESVEELKKKILDLQATEKRLKDENGALSKEKDELKAKLANIRIECLEEFKSKAITKLQEIS